VASLLPTSCPCVAPTLRRTCRQFRVSRGVVSLKSEPSRLIAANPVTSCHDFESQGSECTCMLGQLTTRRCSAAMARSKVLSSGNTWAKTSSLVDLASIFIQKGGGAGFTSEHILMTPGVVGYERRYGCAHGFCPCRHWGCGGRGGVDVSRGCSTPAASCQRLAKTLKAHCDSQTLLNTVMILLLPPLERGKADGAARLHLVVAL